ncbi:MAG: hypothetical protein JXQ68_05740 [Campylobacterales bacterium]|nr:hypothetical protein [Campylobacterales bacterium]
MSNSLDKLKALTDRLEEKIATQKSLFDEPIKTEEKKPQLERKEISLSSVNNDAIDIKQENTVLNNEKKQSFHLGEDRDYNLKRFRELFTILEIDKKCENFIDIFSYKAMNLSGIGIRDEDFGEIRDGKYIQIIVISYESENDQKKKAKNISLGYFGKGETLSLKKKNHIIEFVLRWRYEKVYQNLNHYKHLIEKIKY